MVPWDLGFNDTDIWLCKERFLGPTTTQQIMQCLSIQIWQIYIQV